MSNARLDRIAKAMRLITPGRVAHVSNHCGGGDLYQCPQRDGRDTGKFDYATLFCADEHYKYTLADLEAWATREGWELSVLQYVDESSKS